MISWQVCVVFVYELPTQITGGDRRTTVKDRKKEIGKGLLGKMLADLGIDNDDF